MIERDDYATAKLVALRLQGASKRVLDRWEAWYAGEARRSAYEPTADDTALTLLFKEFRAANPGIWNNPKPR